ncbi:SusD/RagB family nutrient-binding outer membrane lipoprotein [uncultured Muribaculum sp.]|uniref:SusD/RagB family nutrient-binding outer membrane lipoprotein n=1 Tax=uncultured Muribaculum sp. TaxID=1918613 RepID=UPI0025F67B98|nr:SusD/RagB family nutrient-binding outer membrane lipoprotein [uncultured Muribaculum sp.]
MNTRILITSSISGVLLGASLILSGCTDSFDAWNHDPDQADEKDMTKDNLNTGGYFAQMQRGVFTVGKDKGGEYQEQQILTADFFAGYLANVKNAYGVGSTHTDHYYMVDQWCSTPFKLGYTQIMQPWREICKVAEADNSARVARAMATIVKIFAMQRVTDKYGPIPYSRFGESAQVSYDSQQEVYNAFFTELDESTQVLSDFVNGGGSVNLARYDYVYSGQVAKWLKFANSLRLRLAIRISYVDETRARAEIQKALDASYGYMSSPDDDAVLRQNTSFTFTNPLYEAGQSFKDNVMSATAECYLVGLGDPRLPFYYLPASETGEYKGMRNGMTNCGGETWAVKTSLSNFGADSPMPWMRSAETFFILAEAKLRFNLGSRSVMDLYKDGVRASFGSVGASNVEAYLNNTSNAALSEWSDPTSSWNKVSTTSLLTRLSSGWDDFADSDTKLKRIMLQKWIALYPDGQEAWSEMRRTGYPGWVTLATYSYASGVANGQLISRIKYPSSEFTNNTANAQDAVRMLGGQDNAATRLWWDVKR